MAEGRTIWLSKAAYDKAARLAKEQAAAKKDAEEKKAAEEAAAKRRADEDAAAAKTKPDDAVYYPNCKAAKAAGAAPIYRGDPGYRSKLDRDGDGVACE